VSLKVQCNVFEGLGVGDTFAQPEGLLRAVGELADRLMCSRLDISYFLSIPSTRSRCARCSALMIETKAGLRS
jgi:hypothetical protein